MNKVMLIGNVGKDPDVRYVDNDMALATLSLATTERGYTMQNGTVVPDRTDWHNLVFWRGLAKIVEQYVHKGDKLYVEGKIRSRSYDDKQGVKRYVTEIYVDNMELLTVKSSSSSHVSSDSTSSAANSTSAQSSEQNTENNGVLPF